MRSPMRILYLSDSPSYGNFVQCKLAEEGITCDLRRVETRAEFLAALDQGEFDLLLADCSLPSFDVFAVLAALRLREPHSDVPFVLIAEDLGDEAAIEAIKAGATDLVLKRRPARLLYAIRRAARDAEERRARRLELETLRAERDRLALTVSVLGEGVLTTYPDGTVVSINRIAEALTGWTREEAAGELLAEVFPLLNERTRQPSEDPFRKILATGGSGGLLTHAVLVAKDGTERPIAYAGATIRDRTGRVLGAVLSFHEAVAQATDQRDLSLVRKLEALRALAGGIADDFNEVITTLVGHIALAKLSVKTRDEALQCLVTEAEKAAIMAKRLIWRLQLFARDQEPVEKATSVADLVLIGKELERERVEKTSSIADIVLTGPPAAGPAPEMRASGA